jgi:acyl carrier protein|tara:strand:- start:1746 stop:1985 length:240 start_codon:yes stop_codon:yes gene_type:complete
VTNIEKYEKAFVETFEIEKTQIGEGLVYQSIPLWDSVGHMSLIATLEDEFDIMLEMDDVVNFGSYDIGKEILAKYDVKI